MQQCAVFASWVTGPFKSLGTAPLEAMLCGMAVVNDIPEDLLGKDVLRNWQNIVLVDSQSPACVAEAISRLLLNPELRCRIADGGRQFVMEHMSWDKIVQQMEQLYARVLRGTAVTGSA